MYRVFSAEEIKDVKGHPTSMKRSMKNLLSGYMTEVLFLKADYNVGVEDSLFTERYLKQPPKRWIE